MGERGREFDSRIFFSTKQTHDTGYSSLRNRSGRKKDCPPIPPRKRDDVRCFDSAGKPQVTSFVLNSLNNLGKDPRHAQAVGLQAVGNDWKVLHDPANIVFPPLSVQQLRGLIVLWSPLSRKVIMIELTCPAEEGIEAAALRKETRYQELRVAIKAWGECKYCTIEVGARGLVGLRVHKVLLRVGLTPTAAYQRLLEVVARASYAIYLAHDSKTWA